MSHALIHALLDLWRCDCDCRGADNDDKERDCRAPTWRYNEGRTPQQRRLRKESMPATHSTTGRKTIISDKPCPDYPALHPTTSFSSRPGKSCRERAVVPQLPEFRDNSDFPRAPDR